MKRRSSIPIVGALVVSVVGAGVTRSLCIGQRHALEVKRGITESRTANLNGLNSFALGLLLGGLRGPLVMALWTSSENQKSDHDLEDFDTKVELIRLLQPEFDTVHLFQIWNKAYNISVQMANVPNKYTTILDALEYAFSVDRERPDDINILAAIGGLYFDKFGGATEKGYFSPRLQEETLPAQDRVRVTFPASRSDEIVRAAHLSGATPYTLITHEATGDGSKLFITVLQKTADDLKKRLNNDPAVEFVVRPTSHLERTDSSGRRTEHVSLLDDQYDILPKFLAPRADRTPTGDAADGSQLPYDKQFEPYPYGVSPYALAFNYYMRCQWLQANRGARHAQMSDRVISSRPALSLEKWAEEDWYAADRAEIALANREVPSDDSKLQSVTQDLVLDSGLPNCPLMDEAIWRFDNASRIANKAYDEYEFHLQAFPGDELTYRSHMMDVEARSHLTAADAAFLRASRSQGDERRKWASVAKTEYQLAANHYSRYIFRYFMEDEDVEQVLTRDVRNLKRVDVTDPTRLRDDELAGALARLKALHVAANYQKANSEDFREISSYVERSYARLRSLALVR